MVPGRPDRYGPEVQPNGWNCCSLAVVNLRLRQIRDSAR